MAGRIALFVPASIALSLLCIPTNIPDYEAGSLPKLEVQTVYSANPHDPWNRIFFLLFTRKVDLRLSDDFKVEGPWLPTEVMGNPSLMATSRTVERIESGDRAIDPLYPNFFSSQGSERILSDPGFSELKEALQEACSETSSRPALHRALMQSDVWAAYEIVTWSRRTDGPIGDHARALLPWLVQFIAKLALSSSEIAGLPHNNAIAQSSLTLPKMFDAGSGWIELEWFPERSHDTMGQNRHAARIFLKPPGKPAAFLKHVNERIRGKLEPLPGGIHDLDAEALLTQVLLINRDGRVVPSPLISDIQLRTVTRDESGRFTGSNVEEFELSRQLMLAHPSSGGFVHRTAEEPSYLPASGNDFTFASPMTGEREQKTPILGTLRRRCESCHFESSVFTFRMIPIPGRPVPAVRQLPPEGNQRAFHVAEKKMKSREFRSLQLDQGAAPATIGLEQNGRN